MKRFFFIVFSIAFILFGCKKEPKEVEVTAVTISQPTAEMIIGETAQLQVSIVPTNATDKTVTWTSSNQSVATVSESGLVTAISEGVASIAAMAGGISAFCHITVIKGFVEVSSIRLNTSSLYLVEDEQATLSATVFPEDATDKSVIWRSSDTSVASVESGIVSAHKSGTATISAESGKQSAQCIVIVKSKVIPVSEIILNANKLVLMEGQEDELVATVKPDNATVKTITWTSSDESVAKVDSYGRVYAIKGGAAIITATSGEKQAVCLVEVQKRIPVSSVTLNKESLTIEKGDSETLVAEILPDDATDKTVTWASSNPAIVSVSNGSVEAIAGGSATITASAGNQTATCHVTVIVSVKNLVLSETSLTLFEGQSFSLNATLYPKDVTDNTVIWSSDYPEIASVENGTVSAFKIGQATITARASNNVSASCIVSVKESLNGHEFVDLGLSVKWATCNIGADSPGGWGDYFAWGETESKSRYMWSTYKWCNGTEDTLTKYCLDTSYWDGAGSCDYKGNLDSEDDAAQINWGGGWRMPTSAEWTELIKNCKWTWTGSGIKVTSKKAGYTDKSIYLPAAGFKHSNGTYYPSYWGHYWSSGAYYFPNSASSAHFTDNTFSTNSDNRYRGLPIRPVCP